MSSDVNGNERIKTSKSTSLHKNKTKQKGKIYQILLPPPQEIGINQSLAATREAFSQDKLLNLSQNSKLCGILVYLSSIPFSPIQW